MIADHQTGAFQRASPPTAKGEDPDNSGSSKSENVGAQTNNISSMEEQDKKSKKLRGIEVFVGDISFFCKEVDLYKLFSHYGRVMRTRIKRSDKNGRTLMYGFVDMERLDDANRSIKALHGSRFQGRDIRVELSGSRAPAQPARPNHEDYHQIYISFKSEDGNPDGGQLPTETLLREIFEQYSPVKDIAIKEYSYDKTTHIQQGFCFAAFFTLPDAKRVFNTIHGHTHRGFLFSCSVSYHFPLDDDVMTATAAMSLQRERSTTSPSGPSSPRDFNNGNSYHHGRRQQPPSSNDYSKKIAAGDLPVVYPPYVGYGGGGAMMAGYSDVVGMAPMYPHMHMMPPLYPIPSHQVSAADGTYLSVPIPMVPPPQSTYSPSPPPHQHGNYMGPPQRNGTYYPVSSASSVSGPTTPRDASTSQQSTYYGPPSQITATSIHQNGNQVNGTSAVGAHALSTSSSQHSHPTQGTGSLEDKPKPTIPPYGHQGYYMDESANGSFRNQRNLTQSHHPQHSSNSPLVSPRVQQSNSFPAHHPSYYNAMTVDAFSQGNFHNNVHISHHHNRQSSSQAGSNSTTTTFPTSQYSSLSNSSAFSMPDHM